MKVVSAYMLAVLGGNTTPSVDNLKKILGSVGADADSDMIELLVSQLKGKDIDEVIASGREKLASISSGGAVAGVAPAAGSTGAADAASAEQKKEEKVEDEEEEEDADIGGLFGDE
ncbi:60S acidic ribosomal protein P2-like [Argentina anserina]|uniref:60S acidic ribosomal protein P2-like n=1 Tax=Argentina anserina TaxID=57926 RepID=UPI0021765480|nr:60S acidic ribosomal protein P2-like [Potentilla anserina]